MRLQTKEIQAIIRTAKDIYGEGVKVFLFGSRLDDEKRGGDIDLLIRTENEKKGVKIDVIVDHENSLEPV